MSTTVDCSLYTATQGPDFTYGQTVRIQTSGVVVWDVNNVVPKGTTKYAYPEGTYKPDFSNSHASFDPDTNDQLRLWDDWIQSGQFLAPVFDAMPASLVGIIRKQGDPAPTFPTAGGMQINRDTTFTVEDLSRYGADQPGQTYTLWFVFNDAPIPTGFADNVGTFTIDCTFSTDSTFTGGEYGVMRWAEPLSWEDARGGRICAASGAWFPASRLREVDGKVYGDAFAPQPKQNKGDFRRG